MITLLVENDFPIEQLNTALLEEDVVFVLYKWEKSIRSLTIKPDISNLALITSTSSIIAIGERIKETRKIIGDKIRIWACPPQLTERERTMLMKCGADIIITPQSNSPDHVAERILSELIRQGASHSSSYGLLRGATKNIRQLYSEIETLATFKYPVLILGETGTGKDLIAREIHERSLRKGPFLKLNCAELSSELLRSELFGHTKGSFTGAHQTKEGLIFEAGEGTLFLDEIGDLGQRSQAMLLQVLEDYTFRAIGANNLKRLNARLVLATHRDLEQMVELKEFRQDLLARINDFPLRVPPLRERKADIPLLAYHFIENFNRDNPTPQVSIPSGALDCLFLSDWRENVRQLRKAIQKAAVFKEDNDNINTALLKKEVIRSTNYKKANVQTHSVSFDPQTDTYQTAVRRMQKAYLEAIIDETPGVKEKARERSGLGKSRFYELLKEMKID